VGCGVSPVVCHTAASSPSSVQTCADACLWSADEDYDTHKECDHYTHGYGQHLEWAPPDFKRAFSTVWLLLPGSELIIGPWGHGGLTNYSSQKQAKDGGRSAFPQALHTIAFFDRACGYHPAGRCCSVALLGSCRQGSSWLLLYVQSAACVPFLTRTVPLLAVTLEWRL